MPAKRVIRKKDRKMELSATRVLEVNAAGDSVMIYDTVDEKKRVDFSSERWSSFLFFLHE